MSLFQKCPLTEAPLCYEEFIPSLSSLLHPLNQLLKSAVSLKNDVSVFPFPYHFEDSTFSIANQPALTIELCVCVCVWLVSAYDPGVELAMEYIVLHNIMELQLFNLCAIFGETS